MFSLLPLSSFSGASQKSTTRPSTERLLKAFDNITLTFIEMDGQLHRHLTPLIPLQEKILQLLGFSPQIYTDLQEKPGYQTRVMSIFTCSDYANRELVRL